MHIDMDRYELAAILKDVGNFSMDDFAGRLTLQKTVCLLQAFGIRLGYRFGWYLHGPYCRALVKDGYAARHVIDRLPDMRISFEESAQKRYEEFKEFMDDKKNNPALLEICASICYLATEGFDKDAILKFTEAKKASFDHDQCMSMWNELEKYGVIDVGTA